MKIELIGNLIGRVILIVVCTILALFLYTKYFSTSYIEAFNQGEAVNQKFIYNGLYNAIQQCRGDVMIASTTLSVSCAKR
jgi:hypothetical protein